MKGIGNIRQYYQYYKSSLTKERKKERKVFQYVNIFQFQIFSESNPKFARYIKKLKSKSNYLFVHAAPGFFAEFSLLIQQ